MSDERYSAWIVNYLESNNTNGYGRCKEATTEMVKAFPELKRVPGHVHSAWGKRGHFWCVTESGEIVDPTRQQFPGPIEYEVWVPGSEVRVGKCMNCGDEIWRAVQSLEESITPACVCSDVCEKELEREFA